ncbi:MAG: hypothetical protein O9327_08245 [Polaromonas sp.]|nr:hypothetical protein [Polaromonas sp.]
MLKRTLLLACLPVVLLTQGCVYRTIYQAATKTGDFYPVETQTVSYNPATQARLRVRSGYVTPQSMCYGSAPVAANVWALAKASQVLNTGVVGTSTSIGMPRPAGKNGSVWEEQVQPADVELTIRANIDYEVPANASGFGGERVRCDPGGVSFTPKAGRDYETQLKMDGGKCWIQVRELNAQGTDSGGPDVPVSVAPRCG